MYIKLVCPNGHKLRVKEAHAGLQAVCPKCDTRLVIPQPKAHQISDTSVLAVLGDFSATRSVVVKPPAMTAPPALSSEAAEPQGPQQRQCSKCQTLMSIKVRICPKCQLYQSNFSGAAPKKHVCLTCGEICPPGTVACGTCGTILPAA
ncbi:MAG: hypothetical protein AB7O62_13210 [Pirellulales bacterium]